MDIKKKKGKWKWKTVENNIEMESFTKGRGEI